MESSERDAAIAAAPRDVPIRDSAPPLSSRTLGHSHEQGRPSNDSDQSQIPGADVWAGAISRLQTQVSSNTSLLESQRRQIQRLEMDVRTLGDETRSIVTALNELRADLHIKGSAPGPGRHDPGDFDYLIEQVNAINSKANEIDGVKLQLISMKNRMNRLEEQGGPLTRPDNAAGLAPHDISLHEPPPPLLHHPGHSHAHHGSHHGPLPPMRTSSISSPPEARSAALQAQLPALESRGRPSYPASNGLNRQYSGESSGSIHPSPAGAFRPSEPLPPPSSLPGWRSSDSLPHSTTLPPPHLPSAHSRPDTMEPEPQAASWAAINATTIPKRPLEEPRASPYQSPNDGTGKRPKLAPIMPRSSYGDEPYVPSSVGQSGPTETTTYNRSRAASDVSPPQAQASSTAAPANAPSHYRFITSTTTTQADSQESWRPEHERRMHGHHHGHGHGHGHGRGDGHGHGRRGGRRGGRGGRRGRGGGVLLDGHRRGPADWEPAEWAPDGFHHHHPLLPTSPRGISRRGGGFGHEMDIPETPTQGYEDPSAMDTGEGGQGPTSGGKKTRTKPIRNAEGILIRKDGRPDMRSVSSANNLRKVHAKKEAERAEGEGKTPTSASRSLAAVPTNSEERDEEEEAEDEDGSGEHTPPETEGREEERNGSEFEHSIHPRRDEQDAREVQTKTEEDSAQQGYGDEKDVEMRETSEAQGTNDGGAAQDEKMSILEEEVEEEEQRDAKATTTATPAVEESTA